MILSLPSTFLSIGLNALRTSLAICFAINLILISLPRTAHAELNETEIMDLLAESKFEEVFEKISPLVSESALAMHTMAFFYERGIIVQKDDAKVGDLLLSAANNGHVPAMEQLSKRLFLGDEKEKAIEWDRRAWENGSENAGLFVGRAFLWDENKRDNEDLALKYLGRLIDQENKYALGEIGWFYLQRAESNEIVIEAEEYLTKALDMLKRATDAGNGVSSSILSAYFLSQKNFSQAALYGEQAINNNYSELWQTTVSLLLMEDNEFYNPQKAFEIFYRFSKPEDHTRNLLNVTRRILFDFYDATSSILILEALNEMASEEPDNFSNTERVELLYYLAEAHEYVDELAKALNYNQEALGLHTDERTVSIALWTSLIKQRFDLLFFNAETHKGREALRNWVDTVLYDDLLEELNDDDINLILQEISRSYVILGEVKKADQIMKTITMSTDLDAEKEIDLSMLKMLRFGYGDDRNPEKALKITRQTLMMLIEQDPINYKKLDFVIHNLGISYLNLGEFERAKSTLEWSLKLKTSVNASDRLKAGTIQSLAVAEAQLNNFEVASTLMEKSFRMQGLDEGKASFSLYEYYYMRGVNSLLEENKEEAKLYFKKMILVLLDITEGRVFSGEDQLYSTMDSANFPTRKAMLEHIRLELKTPTNKKRISDDDLTFSALQLSNGLEKSKLFRNSAVSKNNVELADITVALDSLRKTKRIVTEDIIGIVSLGDQEKRLNELQKNANLLSSSIQSYEAELLKKFPKYMDLISPVPLSLTETQNLIVPTEGVFTLISDNDANVTYAFFVTKNKARAYTIDLSEGDIAAIVGKLRADIDLSNSFGFGDLPNFDMDLSYDLYSKLFGPVEDMLEGVKHLLVVPTGPLESLPLNLLVTEKPDIDPTASVFENYQAAAWLPKTYSLTRLPSVSSLRALRVFASEGQSQDPFIGFGDPVLDGPAGDLRGLTVEDVYQGGEANIAAVRNLPELPETSEELKRIAAYLGAPEDKIYLRERASETVVKNTNLTNNKVVAFATHGLVGGEISGLAEPALVLSPPNEATDEDDGLLKASEVAQLKMNADMVLLSACNTASGDELGAEGLSGLARAFIYAGARSLLVSHWSVESTSAAELTTGMFDAINQDQELGRSEALQRSMIELMTDEDRPYYSHPAFWAPFSLIGDGQTAQLN